MHRNTSSIKTAAMTCSFCSKFGYEPGSGQLPIQWFDARLTETPNFSVVAGIGAFAPGYLMIIAKAHVLSMAAIPDNWCAEFLSLQDRVAGAIRRNYGSVMTFEHANQDATTSS